MRIKSASIQKERQGVTGGKEEQRGELEGQEGQGERVRDIESDRGKQLMSFLDLTRSQPGTEGW